jgi:hypothetical protein
MSVNRSVQAAQRRRAVPQPTQSSNVQPRTPQPSINSAQAFANQVKPGPGPKIPSGRLAAQQLSNNQMIDNEEGMNSQNISQINKMTVAQAITLITLRLGKLETSVSNLMMGSMSSSGYSSGYQMDGSNENMILVDKSVIESMTSRLESLEKRTTMPAGGRDIELLKQQFEPLRASVAQNKTAIGALIRDHKDMKTNLASVTTDLTETKELVGSLQNLVMDNTQKIVDLHGMIGTNLDTDFNQDEYLGEEHLEEVHEDIQNEQADEYHGEEHFDDEEVVGTNLKELIEQELSGN